VLDGSDGVSPYGYSGPIVTSDADESFCRSAFAVAPRVLARLGLVCAFARMHPFFGPPLTADGLVLHGQTVWIDLERSEEENWGAVRATTRNLIRRGQRLGVQVRQDGDFSHLGDFVRLYHATMRRVGAASWYLFDEDYFRQLIAAWTNRLSLFVAEVEGRILGAGFFTECSGVVQYHLSGTEEDCGRFEPTRVMLDYVRRWAKARGNRVMHLGGGLGAGRDSLFDFKAAFSSLRSDFRTWRVIADREVYQRAVQAWEQNSGVAADGVDGYFPAYRKTAPRS